MNIKIRKIEEGDYSSIIKIGESLHPDWFDKHAIKRAIPLDIKIHLGLLAEIEDQIVGFITYSSEDGEINITWLGVLPKLHRKGIGTALLKEVEKITRNLNVDKISIETLSEKEEFKPYEQTRAFYKKHGYLLESSRTITSKDNGEKFELAKYSKGF